MGGGRSCSSSSSTSGSRAAVVEAGEQSHDGHGVAGGTASEIRVVELEGEAGEQPEAHDLLREVGRSRREGRHGGHETSGVTDGRGGCVVVPVPWRAQNTLSSRSGSASRSAEQPGLTQTAPLLRARRAWRAWRAQLQDF